MTIGQSQYLFARDTGLPWQLLRRWRASGLWSRRVEAQAQGARCSSRHSTPAIVNSSSRATPHTSHRSSLPPSSTPRIFSRRCRNTLGERLINTSYTIKTHLLTASPQIPHLAHLEVRHQIRRHPARNQQRILHHRPRECHFLRYRRPSRRPVARAARLRPDLRVHRLPRQ